MFDCVGCRNEPHAGQGADKIRNTGFIRCSQYGARRETDLTSQVIVDDVAEALLAIEKNPQTLCQCSTIESYYQALPFADGNRLSGQDLYGIAWPAVGQANIDRSGFCQP